MTKKDLIRNIGRTSEIPEQQIKHVIEAFYNEIKEALKRGERVELRGFGTFYMKTLKNATAHDFTTNAPYRIKNAHKPAFTPGKELREIAHTKTNEGSAS